MLTSHLPEPILFRGAALAGTAVARFNASRREVVRRNLARVVSPDVLEETVDEAFRSYARYWVEALRVPRPGREQLRSRTTFEGLEPMVEHLDRGTGVIFVTPHLGSYDLAGAWLASLGHRMVAVAELLEPPALFDMFTSLRQSVGIEIHPHGKASTARALISALRGGAVVGLVADRDISGSGVECEFFGEPTFLPGGPAVLALRLGVPLAAGALFQRPGGRYHGVVLDPIEVEGGRGDPDAVAALTQRIAQDLETLIRREPGQWHLFQPNWPSDPGYRS